MGLGPHLGWFTGAVLYALIWWTVLFAVLPLWTNPNASPDASSGWRGAPRTALMGRKLLLTTGLALVLWIAAVLVIDSDWLSFRRGPLALPPP